MSDIDERFLLDEELEANLQHDLAILRERFERDDLRASTAKSEPHC